jgi:hypothetical protein
MTWLVVDAALWHFSGAQKVLTVVRLVLVMPL